jgi:hypothetical protein
LGVYDFFAFIIGETFRVRRFTTVRNCESARLVDDLPSPFRPAACPPLVRSSPSSVLNRKRREHTRSIVLTSDHALVLQAVGKLVGI